MSEHRPKAPQGGIFGAHRCSSVKPSWRKASAKPARKDVLQP
jgi:hypothetical protein